MKAIICNKLNGTEGLNLETIDLPNAKTGQLKVEVSYAAINFFDTLITRGRYQVKPELPFSPGGEISGRVKEIGSGVSGFAIGDRVMANIGYGGLREQVTAEAEKFIKIPDGVDDQVAAAVSITYGTAMHGLIERANLKAGEYVVIIGAAGGAGLAAIDIARVRGAKIIAIASTEEKLKIAKAYGAEFGILSTSPDIKGEIKSITNGDGADVVYDCVGGDLSEPSLRALKWGGRFLVVGFASGTIPNLPLNLVLLKGIHVSGVFIGRFIKEQPRDYQTLMQELLEWCAAGEIRPHINKIYSLEDAKVALQEIENRRAEGKYLISINSSE